MPVYPSHHPLIYVEVIGYLDNHQLLSASLQNDSNIVVQIGSDNFYLKFSPFPREELHAGSFIMMTDSGSLARKHMYAVGWGRGSVMGHQNGRQLNEKWNMEVSLPTSAAIRVVNANHNRLPCDALRGLSPAPHTVWDQSIHLTPWLNWNVIGL